MEHVLEHSPHAAPGVARVERPGSRKRLSYHATPAGKKVRVAFLDEANKAVPVSDVAFVKTDAYPK